MTDTDKVVDLNEKQAKQRYEASLDFLDGPLLAASNAAHELAHITDDDRPGMIGCINLWAVDLCPAKLWLLEDIAHRLAKDEFAGADDHGDREDAQ